jgi:hypothetical protein
MGEAINALLWMLIGHAVCDFPLQSEWLARGKNPNMHLVPGETIWPSALASHAAIHAGAVKLITGSWLLAAAEFFTHCGIDYTKCRGLLTYNQDQGLHVICKLVWAAALYAGVRL